MSRAERDDLQSIAYREEGRCEYCTEFLADCECNPVLVDDPWSDGEDDDAECCHYCGKELEEFSDIGCEHCDRRSPEWGVMP
jgi:hypothetical protein